VEENKEIALAEKNVKSLDELVPTVVEAIGHNWEEVRKVVLNQEVAR
jgi:hypothetical protein